MGGDLLIAPFLLVAVTWWPFTRVPGRTLEAIALAVDDGRRQRARVLAGDQPRVPRLPAADLGRAALLAAGRHGREPGGRGDRRRLHEQRHGPVHGQQPRRQPAARADLRRRGRRDRDAARRRHHAAQTRGRRARAHRSHAPDQPAAVGAPGHLRSRDRRALPPRPRRSGGRRRLLRPVRERPREAGRSSSATSAARDRRRPRSPLSRATRCAPSRSSERSPSEILTQLNEALLKQGSEFCTAAYARLDRDETGARLTVSAGRPPAAAAAARRRDGRVDSAGRACCSASSPTPTSSTTRSSSSPATP